MVIQHTGCGLNGDEDRLRARVAEATGADPAWPLHAFEDVEVSVRRQLETLLSSPHLVEGSSSRGSSTRSRPDDCARSAERACHGERAEDQREDEDAG